jgi:hypothetical protein
MTIAILSALGFIIILFKLLGLKGLMQYEIAIDAIFTTGFLIFSGGTYSGIVMAVQAGIAMSVSLLIIRVISRPFR